MHGDNTKVVILAGGYGTRISEETSIIPKPMIEIGGKPILWYLMKYYSHFGFNQFILCLGYKQEKIKDYFLNYYRHNSDIRVYSNSNVIKTHSSLAEINENWSIDLIDTGKDTMTGGRLLRIKKYLDGKKTFFFSYGDGLSNIDIKTLLNFHKEHGKIATVSTTQQKERFGVIEVDDKNYVKSFSEKKLHNDLYINIGFFVLNSEIFYYLKDGNQTIFEKKPLEYLVSDNQLMAYKHDGFFKCMDSLKDKTEFEQLIEERNTPWLIWND